MPLIVHSSSTCDICLDNYSETLAPHASSCGHIFCGPCLARQSKCPICRRSIQRSEAIIKLHVDEPDANLPDEYLLLRRLALASDGLGLELKDKPLKRDVEEYIGHLLSSQLQTDPVARMWSGMVERWLTDKQAENPLDKKLRLPEKPNSITPSTSYNSNNVVSASTSIKRPENPVSKVPCLPEKPSSVTPSTSLRSNNAVLLYPSVVLSSTGRRVVGPRMRGTRPSNFRSVL